MRLAIILVFTTLAASPCDSEAHASLWKKMARIFGIPANPINRGPGLVILEGDLYRTASHGTEVRVRVTEGGGYSSPIFGPDDQHILALHGGALVRVPTNRGLVHKPEWLMDLPGAVRLAGFSQEDDRLLVVLLKSQNGRRYTAVICFEGWQLIELEAAKKKELAKLLARLRGSERHYNGVVVESRENEVGGRDVWIRRDDGSVAVSGCDSSVCTQGALSADGERIVFVRSPSR